MRATSLACLSLASLALSGCLAKTAVGIVTAPVKVVGKGVDMATTSQSEADEKRGREIRKREEKLGKLDRRYRKEQAKCDRGEQQACEEARATYAEIQQLTPSVPYEPER